MDCFCDRTKKWTVCSIIDNEENKVKIKYSYYFDNNNDTLEAQREEWLDVESHRLSPLHSHTIDYVELADPPITTYAGPKHIIYTDSSTNKEYIVKIVGAAEDDKENHGIWFYETDVNKWFKISSFPDWFQPEMFNHHVQSNSDNLLYIFEDKFQELASYDIKNHE